MANAKGDMQFVTFALGRETFAAPVSLVREILDFQTPFHIPHGPEFLLGLAEVRGKGVPTIDLRRRLGLPSIEPTSSTRILVIEADIDGRVLTLGLVADRVFEVCAFDNAETESAPDVGVTWPSAYIAGVVRRAGDFVVLLDIPQLFTGQGELIAAPADRACQAQPMLAHA